MVRLLKKMLRILLYCLYLSGIVITILEVSYRYQWFDFYYAELKNLNEGNVCQDKNREKIFIAGDSFTAEKGGYADQLRVYYPDACIVNAGVPGTGIIQMSYSLPKKIRKVNPDVFIYQVYVGNDLFDIRHPYSENIGIFRNMYWWLSDHIRVLGYINFRLAGIRYRLSDDPVGNYKPKQLDVFSPGNYSRREKLNFKAEPFLIENTLDLKNGRERQMKVWQKKLEMINRSLPAETRKYILIIPHAAQVSAHYSDAIEKVGARFSKPVFNRNSWPFYEAIQSSATALGFGIIDVLPDFRRAEEQGIPVYYQNDPHLNAEGQLLLSKILFNRIREK